MDAVDLREAVIALSVCIRAIDGFGPPGRFLHHDGLQELNVNSVVGSGGGNAIGVRLGRQHGPHRNGCGESIPGLELHVAP